MFVGLLASALSPAQNVISVYQIDGSVRVYDKVDSIVCTTDNQEIHSMGRIYCLPVSDVDSVVYESFADFVTPGQEVDLGLSVKWAGWNVGANRPEEYGGYYAWGETEEKAVTLSLLIHIMTRPKMNASRLVQISAVRNMMWPISFGKTIGVCRSRLNSKS